MTPEDLAAYRATYDPDAWAANIARDPGTDGRVQILVGAALAVRALCAEVERLTLADREFYRWTQSGPNGCPPYTSHLRTALERLDESFRALGFVEEALREEIKGLTTERDRLARILAVERGDESQAPEGWIRQMDWPDWFHPESGGDVGRAGDTWRFMFDEQPWKGEGFTSALEAMEAADLARGAAKGPAQAVDIYDQALTAAMLEPLSPATVRDIFTVQTFKRLDGTSPDTLAVRCPVCDARQTLRPLVREVFECHGHTVRLNCKDGRIVSWTKTSPVAKEPTP